MGVAKQQNIYLVGLMGVGKSTIGKRLASRLGLAFIDCDQELERRNGVTVSTIFDIEGEAGFRTRETRLLQELAEREIGIIATGGGIVTQEINRQLLRDSGRVVYLNATVDLLWSRLRYCKNRPLLEAEHPKQVLEKLYEQRDPLYREVADVVINVGKGSAANAVKKIERILRDRALIKKGEG